MAHRRDNWLRTASLIVIGAFAVHQLRYVAANGHDAGSRLAAEGHSYLDGFVPLLAAFVIAAVASLVIRAAAGREPGTPGLLRSRWVAFALAIFCVFAVQESLEGVFASGHASGFAAVFGDGAWWAMPFAALVGLLVALAERRLYCFERRVAIAVRTARTARRRAPRSVLGLRARATVSAGLSPLAFGLARRPPPLPS